MMSTAGEENAGLILFVFAVLFRSMHHLPGIVQGYPVRLAFLLLVTSGNLRCVCDALNFVMLL